jgi:hypothetical protein
VWVPTDQAVLDRPYLFLGQLKFEFDVLHQPPQSLWRANVGKEGVVEPLLLRRLLQPLPLSPQVLSELDQALLVAPC